jgi:hypothetical protein
MNNNKYDKYDKYIKLTIHDGFTHKSKPITFNILSEIKLRDLFRLIIMVFYPGHSMTDTYICDNFMIKIIVSNEQKFEDIIININTLYISLIDNGFVSDANVFLVVKNGIELVDKSEFVNKTYNLDPVIQDSDKVKRPASCAPDIVRSNDITDITDITDIEKKPISYAMVATNTVRPISISPEVMLPNLSSRASPCSPIQNPQISNAAPIPHQMHYPIPYPMQYPPMPYPYPPMSYPMPNYQMSSEAPYRMAPPPNYQIPNYNMPSYPMSYSMMVQNSNK